MTEREPLPDLLKKIGESYCTQYAALSFASAVVIGGIGLWPSNIPREENIATGFWVSMAILFAGRLVKETIDVSRKKAAPEL